MSLKTSLAEFNGFARSYKLDESILMTQQYIFKMFYKEYYGLAVIFRGFEAINLLKYIVKEAT